MEKDILPQIYSKVYMSEISKIFRDGGGDTCYLRTELGDSTEGIKAMNGRQR